MVFFSVVVQFAQCGGNVLKTLSGGSVLVELTTSRTEVTDNFTDAQTTKPTGQRHYESELRRYLMYHLL